MMVLQISGDKTLLETQEEFSAAYPFLKIEFYRITEPAFARKHLNNSMSWMAAGIRKNGELKLDDVMTVRELENSFALNFGLNLQVSRRSGTLWLETTMTNNWTLKQQNDHGRELAELTSGNAVDKKHTPPG